MFKVILVLGWYCIHVTDSQCIDARGAAYCRNVLQVVGGSCARLPANEFALCPATCRTCRPVVPAPPQRNPQQPPAFARITTTQRNIITHNNFNSFNMNRNNARTETGLALPIWAVVLILVLVIILFVGVTALYFCCKQKRKLRKMEKNRILLQRTAPSSHQQSAQPMPSAWDDIRHDGSTNECYVEDGLASKNSYIPGKSQIHTNAHNNWIHNNLNNASTLTRPVNRYLSTSQKNVNIQPTVSKNETLKRKAPAPPPPEDQVYENLPVALEEQEKKQTRRAPPPPPPEEPDQECSTVVSKDEGDFVDAAIHQQEETLQQNSGVELNPSQTTPPSAFPRTLPRNLSKKNTAERNRSYEEDCEDETSSIQERIRSVDSESTSSESEVGFPNGNVPAGSTSTSVMEDWVEHLCVKKSELEEYYNRLTGYIENMSVQPADSVSNIDPDERFLPPRNAHEAGMLRPQLLNSSLHRTPATFGTSKLGEPDWYEDSDDIHAQRKLVSNLKVKLSELERLLQNASDFDNGETSCGVSQVATETATSAFSLPPALPPKDLQTFAMLQDLSSKRERTRNSHTLPATQLQRITMKSLLARVDQQEGERLLEKIDKILDVSRQHLNKALKDRTTDIAPSTRIVRQIHHVMRDVVDPRLQTNILLAAQASSNLAVKLAKCVVSEQVSMSRRKKYDIKDVYERINVLTKQLLQMVVELEKNKHVVRKRDINSFIDAFSQNALKIMEACHTYVYVYSVSKKDEPWIVTSQRHKSLQSTSVQIKASLQSGDIARLSEGLSKLEQLLKQGNFSEAESTLSALYPYDPIHHESFGEDGTESTFSCGSECESVSSCSTCMPLNDFYGRIPTRNPYVFPGDKDDLVMSRPNPVNQQQYAPPIHKEMATENPYMRPPMRPKKSIQRNPSHPTNDTAYADLKGWKRSSGQPYYGDSYPEDTLGKESEMDANAHHQLMLAKYLNDLLKTQEVQHTRQTNLPRPLHESVSKPSAAAGRSNSALLKNQPACFDLKASSDAPGKAENKNNSDIKMAKPQNQPQNGKKVHDAKTHENKLPHDKNQKKTRNQQSKPYVKGEKKTEPPHNKYKEEDFRPNNLNEILNEKPLKPKSKANDLNATKPDKRLDSHNSGKSNKQPVTNSIQETGSDFVEGLSDHYGEPDEHVGQSLCDPNQQTDKESYSPEPVERPGESPENQMCKSSNQDHFEQNDQINEPDESIAQEYDKANEQANQRGEELEQESDKPNKQNNDPGEKTGQKSDLRNEQEKKVNGKPGKNSDEPNQQHDTADEKPSQDSDEPNEQDDTADEKPSQDSDEQCEHDDAEDEKPDQDSDEPHEQDDTANEKPDHDSDEANEQGDTADERRSHDSDEPSEQDDRVDENPGQDSDDEPNEQDDAEDEKPDQVSDEPNGQDDTADEKPGQNSDKPNEKDDTANEKPGQNSDEPNGQDDTPDEKPDPESDESNEQRNTADEKPDHDSDEPNEDDDTADEKPDQDSDAANEQDDTADEKPDQDTDDPNEQDDTADEKPDHDSDEPNEDDDTADENPDQDSDETNEQDDEENEKSGQDSDEENEQDDTADEKPDHDSDEPNEQDDDSDTTSGRNSDEISEQNDEDKTPGQDSNDTHV